MFWNRSQALPPAPCHNGRSSPGTREESCTLTQGVDLFSLVPLVWNQGVFGGEEEGGGVRSGPGSARTILLFHIISARPSKHPLMVRTFLKVYMELGSYFLFLQEQIKDIII